MTHLSLFDSVLNKGAGPKSAFGRGAVFSVLLHVGVIALAVWLTSRPKQVERELTEVTFFSSPAAPLPPAKLGTDAVQNVEPPKPTEKKKVVKKPDTFVQPKEEAPVQKEEPVAETEAEDVAPPEEKVSEDVGTPNGVPEGDEQGSDKGKIGGLPTGREDGTQPLGTGTDVVRFGEGMTLPRKIGGEDIQYTREAREAKVEGTAIVECVITVEGTLESCRFVKALPLMEEAILRAVGTWRYTPVIYQGRPVNVRKVFNITLKLH